MGDSERALVVDGEVRMKQTLKDERDGNNLFKKILVYMSVFVWMYVCSPCMCLGPMKGRRGH